MFQHVPKHFKTVSCLTWTLPSLGDKRSLLGSLLPCTVECNPETKRPGWQNPQMQWDVVTLFDMSLWKNKISFKTLTYGTFKLRSARQNLVSRGTSDWPAQSTQRVLSSRVEAGYWKISLNPFILHGLKINGPEKLANCSIWWLHQRFADQFPLLREPASRFWLPWWFLRGKFWHEGSKCNQCHNIFKKMTLRSNGQPNLQWNPILLW